MRVPSRYLAVGGGALLAAAVAFTSAGEGRRYVAYRDSGGVLTVCDGHTGADIIAGKRYSDAECDAILKVDILAHERRMLDCAPELATVPPKTYIALNDWAFNVGTGAACKSSLIASVKAGNLAGACRKLSDWVYVKHVYVKGLANRRVSERALCLEGLKQ